MAREPADIARNDGKLFHEDQEYVRGLIRNIWCEVTELVFVSGFSQDNTRDAPSLFRAFKGKAHLTRDTISIVGTKITRATKLDLSIRRAVDENASEENCADQAVQELTYGRNLISNIGFTPCNWEFIDDESLWLEIEAPAAVFDTILSEYETGKMARMTVGLRAGLWARSFDWHAPPSSAVRWYLFPEKIYSESTSFEMARGHVTSLSVDRLPAIEPPPPTSAVDDEEPADAPDPQPLAVPVHVPMLTETDRKALNRMASSLWVLACAVVVYVGVNLWRAKL